MTALKSLTFTTLPKPSANPTLDRRTKIIARLEEQKRLLVDPTYMRSVRSGKKKDEVGEKRSWRKSSASCRGGLRRRTAHTCSCAHGVENRRVCHGRDPADGCAPLTAVGRHDAR
jgi:hypothetical protein